MLIVLGHIICSRVLWVGRSFESVVVEAVDCCRLLCALESSSFVEAVESVVVEAVDCCRPDYSSSFVEAVECVVVEDVDWFVSYIMWSREL